MIGLSKNRVSTAGLLSWWQAIYLTDNCHLYSNGSVEMREYWERLDVFVIDTGICADCKCYWWVQLLPLLTLLFLPHTSSVSAAEGAGEGSTANSQAVFPISGLWVTVWQILWRWENIDSNCCCPSLGTRDTKQKQSGDIHWTAMSLSGWVWEKKDSKLSFCHMTRNDSSTVTLYLLHL